MLAIDPEFWSSPVVLQAITAAVTIFTLVWNSRRERKKVETKVEAAAQTIQHQNDTIQQQNDRQEGKIDAVHETVNGQKAALEAKVSMLQAQLEEVKGRRK